MHLSVSALIALLLLALLAGLIAGFAYRRLPASTPQPRRHPAYLPGMRALSHPRREAAPRHFTRVTRPSGAPPRG